MGQTDLMGNCGNFKVTSPAIMNKDRKSEPIGKMLIQGFCSPVERCNDEGEKFSLKRPEPPFLPFDFHSGLISAINISSFHPVTYEFISGNGFLGNPVNCFHQCTFTDRRIKNIPEHFGQPVKGHKLTGAHVCCKAFNVMAIADTGRNSLREISDRS